MTSPTRTDPIGLGTVRRIAREAEERRLVNMILTALDPFRPDDFTLYRMEEHPGIEFRARFAGTVIVIPIDEVTMVRYPVDTARLVAQELRKRWHAIDPPADSPNIERGTE